MGVFMRLVTVASFAELTEAPRAKNLLEAEGIRVFLADENATALFGEVPAFNPGREPKLQVPEDRAERAEQLLKAVQHPR
jgi:hypothetical protein